MANLQRVITKNLKNEELPSTLPIIRTFPERKSLEEATFHGFEIDSDSAYKLAIQLLIASKQRDKCRLYFNKINKEVFIEIEKENN